MNKRHTLLNEISKITENEDIQELVTDFINDIEDDIGNIFNLLDSVGIDSMENIKEASDLADILKEELY